MCIRNGRGAIPARSRLVRRKPFSPSAPGVGWPLLQAEPAHLFGPVHRGERLTSRNESRRCCRIEIGSERHHQHIALGRFLVGEYVLPIRVEGPAASASPRADPLAFPCLFVPMRDPDRWTIISSPFRMGLFSITNSAPGGAGAACLRWG